MSFASSSRRERISSSGPLGKEMVHPAFGDNNVWSFGSIVSFIKSRTHEVSLAQFFFSMKFPLVHFHVLKTEPHDIVT